MRTGHHFAGVLGWPLEHTLSPPIHNAAFRALSLDWVYFPWPVPPDALAPAIGGIRALGAMGANVTMPHKESVIEYLDQVSGDASAVGAVNTIQRFGDELIGHNTDVDGFKAFMSSDAGADPVGTGAVILGSGGAARAVVRALADLGANSITIVARDEERAASVAAIGGDAGRIETFDRVRSLVEGAEIVVNATPLGTNGEDPVPDARWHAGQLVVDIVYLPPTTPMVRRARSGGANAWNGLGMLVHQAAASFRIWTGMDPSLEAMSAAAVRAMRSA